MHGKPLCVLSNNFSSTVICLCLLLKVADWNSPWRPLSAMHVKRPHKKPNERPSYSTAPGGHLPQLAPGGSASVAVWGRRASSPHWPHFWLVPRSAARSRQKLTDISAAQKHPRQIARGLSRSLFICGPPLLACFSFSSPPHLSPNHLPASPSYPFFPHPTTIHTMGGTYCICSPSMQLVQ